MPQAFSGPLTILDANGDLVDGALINTYAAGTSTRKAVYTTAALSVPHPNPLPAPNGRAKFFLGGGAYRIEVTDPDGAVLSSYSLDNVTADEAGGTGASAVERYTATAAQTAFPLAASYTPGSGDLSVFANGIRLRISDDYQETNSGLVTLTRGAKAGWEFDFDIKETL